jgi:hypothetical protein
MTSRRLASLWLRARNWTASIAADVGRPISAASHQRRAGSRRAAKRPMGTKRQTFAAVSTNL